MADVNANIGIQIDTSAALAQLKTLQNQISNFNQSILKSNATAMMAQRDMTIDLMRNISATGKFSAEMRTIRTTTEAFTHALETNKLSMREYFRYAGASTKSFGRLFKTEFDTINKVARERVKDLQTRYIKLGRDAQGAMKAIAIRPAVLDMENYATKTQIAAQRQQLLNQLIKQGSTNLLNFGKNTQWAGRQLMVGFTIPLTMLGSVATRTFRDMEKEVVKFKRVYGEMFTGDAETEKALQDVMRLGQEFTKYGIALKDTMGMAADAAQAGFAGVDLIEQTRNANKLAVLGQVEQQQALETTISLQNAFNIAAEDLSETIDFLNSVENQTVTGIEDLTIAIPKAAPVIKQLGGDVKDLAFFLTAMKEGGVNASEGANAIKSGLASLINPTKKAAAMLNDMGINIQAIVEGNKGNLREIVIDFAQALDQLDPLQRARAIEQLFGKFQFARLSTLFQNVIKDGSQASRVLNLAGRSVEELAILSERELGAVEDSIGVKFQAAIENLKKELLPLGKAFLEAVTPVVKFFSSLLERFNGLSDGTKKTIAILTAVIGGLGPIFLMTFGLLANGIANIIKLFGTLRSGYLKLSGNTKLLGTETTYMTSEQAKNAAVAASLNQTHNQLAQAFSVEASALRQLTNALRTATAAQQQFAMTNPRAMMPGFKPGGKLKGYSTGVTSVPGSGNSDSVLAALTPREAVIPATPAQRPENKPIIRALVADKKIPGFKDGTEEVPGGKKSSTYEGKLSPGQRTNVTQLPDDYKQIPRYILEERFKPLDDFYASKDGQPSRFEIERAKQTPKNQQRMDMLRTSYLRNRSLIIDSLTDRSSFAYKPGTEKTPPSFAAIGKGGAYWSILSDDLFKDQLAYNAGVKPQKGSYSGSPFTISRIKAKLPTKFGMGASKDVRKKAMATLDKKDKIALEKESNWIKKKLVRSGITDGETLRNYSRIDLSHLEKPEDAKSKWTKGRVVADSGLINKYLQYRVDTSGTPALLGLANKISSNPSLMKAVGYDEKMLARVKEAFTGLKGRHPVNTNDYRMIQEIARFEMASGKAGLLSGLKMQNPGVLGTVVSDFVNSFRGAGLPKSRPVFDLAKMLPEGTIKDIVEGGVKRRKDTKAVAINAKEAILTEKGVKSLQEKTGKKSIVSEINKGRFRIPGKYDGYDPTGNRISNYGSAIGPIDPVAKSMRRQADKLEKRGDFAGAAKLREQALLTNVKAIDANTASMTAASQEGINAKEKFREMSGKAAMAAGAVSGLTIAASFAGGKIGEMAQQAMPFIFAIQGIATLLPMMTNPWVAAIAAVVAIGGAIWKFKKDVDDARKEGANLAKAMASTAEDIKSFAEMTKTVSATELRKRQQATALSDVSPKERIFGQNYMESDAGKVMLSDIEKQTKEGLSKNQVAANIANNLAVAITQGVLTSDQANSIAAGLGEKLRDYSISANIVGELSALIGTNGVDLLRDPLTVRLKIAEDSADQTAAMFEKAMSTIAANKGANIQEGIGTAMLAAGTAMAATGLVTGGAGLAAGAIVGGIGAGINYFGDKKDATENAKYIGAAVQLGTQQLANNQGLVDSLNREYDMRIKNAATAEEAARLEQERVGKVDTLIAKNSQYLNVLKQQMMEVGKTGNYDQISKAIEDATLALYKDGPMKVFAEGALAEINKLTTGSSGQISLQLMLASGELDPSSASRLAKMFINNETASANFDMIVKTQGLDEANMFLQMLNKTDLSDNAISKLMENFSKKNKNFDGNMKALQALTNIPSELDSTLVLRTKGWKKINELRTEIEELEKYPDPITKDIVAKLYEADPVKWANLYNQFDKIAGADGKVERKVVVSFQALGDPSVVDKYLAARGITSGTVGGTAYGHLADLARGSASTMADAQTEATQRLYGLDAAGNKIPTSATTTETNTGGPKSSPLDDLLAKLKQLRKIQIPYTQGWEASSKALSKFLGGAKQLTRFTGMSQQIRAMKGSESLIDLVIGMSPEDWEKYKDQLFDFDTKGNIKAIKSLGWSIAEAFRDISIGEFQNQQESTLRTTIHQVAAFKKLTDAGIDAQDAYAAIADTAFASAIAHKDITVNLADQNNELTQLVTAWKKATAARKEYETIESLREENDAYVDKVKMVNTLYSRLSQFNNEQRKAILENEDLQTMLINPQFNQTEFTRRLQQVLDEADLELKIKMLTIEGMEDIFNEGFQKAMESFDAKEKQLTLDFQMGTNISGLNEFINQEGDKFQFNIGADETALKIEEDKIAKLQYQLDDYDAGITEIEDKELEINKAYDAKLEALDAIEKTNERISRQQKAQLTIADALSQGDIAAAAKAVQDLRTQEAQDAIDTQKESLKLAQETALAGIQSRSGFTRAQLEEKIRGIKQQIFKIEEEQIEPIKERIRLGQTELDKLISQVTVLGKSRLEWEAVKNKIDIAKTSSDAYNKAIQDAADIVKSIVDYWNGVPANKQTVHTILTQYEIKGTTPQPLGGSEILGANGCIPICGGETVPQYPTQPIQTTKGSTATTKGSTATTQGTSIITTKGIIITTPPTTIFIPQTNGPTPKPDTNITTLKPIGGPVYVTPQLTPEPVQTPKATLVPDAIPQVTPVATLVPDGVPVFVTTAIPDIIPTGVPVLKPYYNYYTGEWVEHPWQVVPRNVPAVEPGNVVTAEPTPETIIPKPVFVPHGAYDNDYIVPVKTPFVPAPDIPAVVNTPKVTAAPKPQVTPEPASPTNTPPVWTTAPGPSDLPSWLVPAGIAIATGAAVAAAATKGLEKVQGKLVVREAENILKSTPRTSATTIRGGVGLMPILGGGGGMPGFQMNARGGLVRPKYFAKGSLVRGTDTIPSLLTPGEFVVRRHSVQDFGVDKLRAINNGTYKSGSVYNYELNVNVQSDSDPNEIANVVMRNIRQIEGQRLRGVRL